MPYTDDDLLKIVGEERKRSIGFGEGDSGELTGAREKALAYAKGEMADVTSLPNRSKAVDTTVADAIETVLPDVLEVFVGGEDVATFIPQGEADEEQAQQETDFVNHVVLTENPGFLNFYTAFKDAMLSRTGILHWWREDEEKTETKANVTAEMAPMAQAVAQQMGQELEPQEQEDGSVALNATSLHLKVKIRAFPSEDFTVAPDTVTLKDATYCAVRDRPRVQELIARGIDPELARSLPTYSLRNDTIEVERDQAGEHEQVSGDGTGDLRMVEVRAHFIRLADDDGKLTIWRVVTDSEERILLDKEEVDHIPFAALTPYIVPHRFYGESVADKLIEVQKIKTVLLRMLLDSGYFALNQRMSVDMTKANEFTVADLLANEPGRPIRTNGEGAVIPVSAGALNFDVFSAMEFVATMAESRSGIVRNAQGLNPDTLHDTAQGAMALVAAAQKRVRMIARIFAETGVKDLYLGVHCLLRTAHTPDHAPMSAKLRNKWAQVEPNGWSERCDMAIHVGIGSAGREHELSIANQRLQLMAEGAGELQGAGVMDAKNIHAALVAWERAAGSKSPDLFWSDPSNAPTKPPQPDPAMAEVQGKLQIEQAKVQAKVQGDAQAAQANMQLQQAKHQSEMQQSAQQAAQDLQLQRERMQMEMELKRYQIDQELELERQKLSAQIETQRMLGMAQANSQHQVGMAKVSAQVDQVEAGGEPG